MLGCYGDKFATTPHLDQLASEGFLYTNAYANAPVCAPARNTIITGVHACSNGNEQMRSSYPKSETVRFYTEYLLKGKGYYCTNNSKTDYNTSSANPEPCGMRAAARHITGTGTRDSPSLPSLIYHQSREFHPSIHSE